MSIIQDIRDKYAKWAVILIALAIIGFLLMDVNQGRSRLMAGAGGGSIGSVNGTKIKFDDFNKQVEMASRNFETQQPGISNDAKQGQAVEAIWNQEIAKIVLDEELNKLGITVTETERADMIAGERPLQAAQSYLTQQGQPYNGAQALQTINSIRRGNNAEQKDQVAELLKYFDRVRLEEKYNALFSAAANIPRWILESENADASRIASASFVRVMYTDSLVGPDSNYKVTDEEVLAYVNKRKKQFKQTESRSVSYVAFSAAPSSKDSSDARIWVAERTEDFKNTTNTKEFLNEKGTDLPYGDNYTRAADIQQSFKDTLLSIPVGGVFGPYLDNAYYITAKMVESKMVPDSVTVRHILIATAQQDQQTGQFQQIRDTAEARKFMNDSVIALIKSGVPFDSVCKKYSADGNKDQGGIYKNVPWGKMVPPFNDFIFTQAPGSKGVVYTDFGFHYIEVLSFHGAPKNRVVKLAFLGKQILTSQETENDAAGRANTFAGKARDQKSFDEIFEKELKPQGLVKGIMPNLTPTGFTFGNLGESRKLVKAIYEAKKGEVVQPEKVGTSYVVAVVSEVINEGTQSASSARINVEYTLRNKKKADAIRKKIGSITTLEAASAALGKPIERADSISSANTKGIELQLVGALFNPANKGKVIPELLAGNTAAYVVQVNSTGTAPLASVNITAQRANYISQHRNTNTIQALREAAKIKDKRKEFY
jgi:peptidyl-prolyl cis-trans isomerase D